MPKYDNAKLIHRETGEEIKQGAKVLDFKGRKRKFLYISQLPAPGKQGKIMVGSERDGEMTPSVLVARIQPPIGEERAGCWFEGSQGWQNSVRVIEAAESWGMKVTDAEHAAMDAYKADHGYDESESINGQGELSDRATEWLQSLAPTGYQFVWDTAELSLMTDEEAELFGG